jgi:nucleotidyltransferase/DNA polymerase involved in DNA repair
LDKGRLKIEGAEREPPLGQRVREPPLNKERRVEVRGAAQRIGCILVKDFPLAAAVRQNPDLRDRPLVLVESAGRRDPTGIGNLECRYVSARARATGVRAGMTVAKARATAPGLSVLNRAPAAETSAAEALVDLACSLSPLVETGTDGEVYFDLGGLRRLYKEREAETALAQEALGRAARLGLDVAVGIASNKEVAMLAARCGGARVIAAEREAEFLNWIPLDLIVIGTADSGREDAELVQRLARLGIRRLGELARLDIRAAGSRLGARAVELIRIARGESRTPLIARRPTESFTETIELEWGVDNLEAMGFVMRAMLERLGERMEMRGMAAGELTLALELDDRRRDIRRIALPAPTVEARTLLALVILNLESAPPPAAITALNLTAAPRSSRAAQADMFAPPCPTPERMHVVLARLAAMYGPDRIGTLAPRKSYLPGAVQLGPFNPDPAVASATRNGKSHLPTNSTNGSDLHKDCGTHAPPAWNVIAVRALRPPRAIEVLCVRGEPEFVRGDSFGGRVVSRAGPWRIVDAAAFDNAAGASISDKGAPCPARDYYDAALEDGGVYRLFRDLRSGEWYVDGLYD